jgi:phosphoribosyl-AMP cyclohydrolase
MNSRQAFTGQAIFPVQRLAFHSRDLPVQRNPGALQYYGAREVRAKLQEEAWRPLPPGTWDGSKIDPTPLLSAVKFNSADLVPAIAQQYDTGEVLMMAWMNAESITETLREGRAVYYSRSRKKLWRKGETSGQIQVLCDVLLDCDGDTLVLKVDQKGVACHTGRRTCFYNAYRPPFGTNVETHNVLMDPNELYGTK